MYYFNCCLFLLHWIILSLGMWKLFVRTVGQLVSVSHITPTHATQGFIVIKLKLAIAIDISGVDR